MSNIQNLSPQRHRDTEKGKTRNDRNIGQIQFPESEAQATIRPCLFSNWFSLCLCVSVVDGVGGFQ
jgi:hypothetical protein